MKTTRTNRSIKKHRPKAIPNRLAPGSARSQNMQNEPNFNRNWRNHIWSIAQLFTCSNFSPLARRTQFHFEHRASRIELREYAKRTQSNHRDYNDLTRINRNSQISALFFSQKALTFLYFYSKMNKKTRTFTHFFDGFSIPFASFIQSFMQNEPNSTNEQRKYSKRTQSHPTGHARRVTKNAKQTQFTKKKP
jgi:hypothetical protein